MRLRAYVDLMKLRVVELLIITTIPAMVLAERGLPSFQLVAATLIGGTLAAGSANAFNMVIEAETDKLMARTSKRPLVVGSRVIFFWTPPHFWALAIKYKEDYSAAGIPMLPSVSSQSSVIGQMWFHTIAMVISSTALIQLAKLPVWVLCATVLLGAIFTFQLFALKENSENYNKVASGIFHWSITYLSLFSVLLVVAQLLSA